MPVLAVARLWFEGNAFSPLATGAAQFAAREWTRGAAAIAAARGTETELGAVTDFLDRRGDWRAAVSRCAAANPGGPIAHPVFEQLAAEVLEDFRAAQPDAIYLSLHGAAITDRLATPDAELVARVRRAFPGVPLAASFDLHGNMPPAIAADLDFATGYRTYPHVDMRATAARALDALAARAAGAPPWHGTVEPLGLALPSFNMRSDAAPMADLLAAARARERAAPVPLELTLFGGFPYADTAHTGSSVMAFAADAGLARAAARDLAALWRVHAPAFAPRLVTPEAGLQQAAALLEHAAPGRPVAVTDPADNPLSGGAADTPALARALLAARRDRGSRLAGLAAGEIVFAYFFDPEAVAHARRAGVGALLDLRLGARLDARFGAPVAVRGRVVALTDGRFVNTGPMERGAAVGLGDTAVLDVDGIHVILTSQVGAANDPAFFRLHGVDLARVRLLCVKAKNHFRAAFLPLAAAIIDVDCPGPAAADLAALPRRRD
ncbi:MAG: M81 family metallopeptidase [Burkholderiales bacterium]|nr:M81 family metallopeptidase [Burkholderiales bacterium]